MNRNILQFLSTQKNPPVSLFDLPCGDGSFLSAAMNTFPKIQASGQDLFAIPLPEMKSYIAKADAKDWSRVQGKKFSVISCISGVMAFDDISGLFQRASAHLEKDGLFIVSNDNVMSLRDRLHFLFFGRVKRFQLLYSEQEGNWNLILPQALYKLAKNNGFAVEKVEYLTPRLEDWLLAPFGLVFYVLQFAYLLLQKSQLPLSERLKLFPPQMMWMRHMIFYFRK